MDLIRQTLADLAPVRAGSTHGNLTLFALASRPHRQASGDPQQPDVAEPGNYLGLAEALKQNLVEIEEVSDAGSVPTLRAHNRASLPVFLLDGEELLGAKQNRVTNVSILLAPGTTTDIPVSCVEAGRWSRRSPRFESAGRTQFAAGRARRSAAVSQSLMRRGSYRSDQGEVWDGIASKARRMGVESATGAMADIYEHHADDLDAYASAFTPQPGQRGAVFAVGERLVGLELFDHPDMLRAYLPGIVTGYALDALERRATGHVPSPAAATDLVDEVMHAQFDARDGSVGLGQDVRIAERRLAGGALVHEERVVHLAAFRLEGESTRNDPDPDTERRARDLRTGERIRRYRR